MVLEMTRHALQPREAWSRPQRHAVPSSLLALPMTSEIASSGGSASVPKPSNGGTMSGIINTQHGGTAMWYVSGAPAYSRFFGWTESTSR